MCEATANVLAAQTEIGCILRDGSHPSIKVLARKAGWEDQKFARYFPANPDEKPTQLPVGALYTLLQRKVLPRDLMNLLLPDGEVLVHVPATLDLDELSARCAKFLRRKGEAHHPDSADGCDLADCEIAELVVLAEQVKAAA